MPDAPAAADVAPAGGEAASLRDVERRHIERVLEEHEWNITRAAHALGIDRVTLYAKIRKYGLVKPGT